MYIHFNFHILHTEEGYQLQFFSTWPRYHLLEIRKIAFLDLQVIFLSCYICIFICWTSYRVKFTLECRSVDLEESILILLHLYIMLVFHLPTYTMEQVNLLDTKIWLKYEKRTNIASIKYRSSYCVRDCGFIGAPRLWSVAFDF